jgi:hypothetical protein
MIRLGGTWRRFAGDPRPALLAPVLSCPARSPTLGGMRWMSSDGHWTVELVTRTASNGQDGDWLRVTYRGFYKGEARDWDGVARLGVDIGDLREALDLAAVRGSAHDLIVRHAGRRTGDVQAGVARGQPTPRACDLGSTGVTATSRSGTLIIGGHGAAVGFSIT